MDRNVIAFAMGVVYILFFTGMAAVRIGSIHCGELFTAMDAVIVALCITFPFILGYRSGREE